MDFFFAQPEFKQSGGRRRSLHHVPMSALLLHPDRLRPSGYLLGINLEKELQTKSAQLSRNSPLIP